MTNSEDKVKNFRALLITMVDKYDLFSYDIKLIDVDDNKKFRGALFDFYISYLEKRLEERGYINDKDFEIEQKEYGILFKDKVKELEDMIMY